MKEMIPYGRNAQYRKEIPMKIATLVIITRGNKILLGRKQGSPEIGKGTLNGPGGKIEKVDTSILDCAIRETKEELGIILNPMKIEKCAVIMFHAAGIPDFETHTYRTSDFIGEPRETESMVPEWHAVDAIPFERMLESDERWLPRVILGERFRANVYYRERAKGLMDIRFLPFEE